MRISLLYLLATAAVVCGLSKPKCMHSAYYGTIADLDSGKPLGEPVHEATVGTKVVHRWHCDGNEVAGVSFRNCYVSDGETRLADVIDQRGCSMDALLVSAIRRSADQRTTFIETEVFKYANQSELWYFCEAQTCVEGRCDEIMSVDASKEEQLLVPARAAQPAPTPDLDSELEELMRHSNGTYQPAYIVAGRLQVRPLPSAAQPEVRNALESGLDAKDTPVAELDPVAGQKPPAAPLDEDAMEKMTYGRPLSGDGIVVLVVGLGTLMLLSLIAFAFLLARRYERVLECGKREYNMS